MICRLFSGFYALLLSVLFGFLCGCEFTEELQINQSTAPTTTTTTTTTTTIPNEFAIGQSSISKIDNYEKSINYVRSVKLLDDKVLSISGDENRVLIWKTFPTQDMQKADLVVGDTDFAGSKVGNYGNASAEDLNYPHDIEASENKLFVSDLNNHRVLIYSTFPTENGRSANLVLGQTSMSGKAANAGGSVNASTLNGPYHISFDGTRLIVADTGNHRVLIWNSIPTTNGQAADLVLGQANFTTNASGTTATTLKSPQGVHSDGTKLYVADTGNHRVLIWDNFPTSNGQAADRVLGQTTMTGGGGNAGGLSASSLSSPRGIESDGTNLVVTDGGNRRVLIWTSAITANNQAANRVVCQPNMTSNAGIGTYNNMTASNCSGPFDVSIKSGRLAVADNTLSRILIWTTLPTTDGQAANLVLGQRSLILQGHPMWGNEPIETAASMHFPSGFSVGNRKLAVSEQLNNRVLLWNTLPEKSGVPADIVLGQQSFSEALSSNRGLTPAADTMQEPYGVWTDGTKVAVADSMNSRILLWNTWPTVNNQPADLVLGQPNFSTITQNTGSRSATSLSRPFGVCSDGQKIVVVDTYNNRALIWNTWPTTNGQAADVVLGQADFVGGSANAGGLSKSSFYAVWSCFTDGSRLLITDPYQSRILVWNTFPTTNKQSADFVLGQVNGSTGGANQGLAAPTSGTINFARSASFYGEKILVSDTSNRRILQWNTWPTTDGQAADLVFGQPDFTTISGNYGGLASATSFVNPMCGQELEDRYLFMDGVRARITVKRK